MPTPQQRVIPARQPEDPPHGARIKVVGVGGGGNNAIDRMIASGMEGVEFVALNTDIQALKASKAEVRQQIGARLTHGLGAGSDPDIGRRAAIQDSDLILEALDGADMVFVTAGLGGGTGTGAAPVIAALASEMGALTVAIVTRPFGFEGKRRMAIADWGIHHLLNYVDTLIVIPNEKLLAIASDAPFFESFLVADDFLRQAVQGISDIITTAGVINRDFADVRTTMAGMGYGVMGTASRSGPNRAIDAVMGAMASPLLEAGAINGARGILINVSGSSSLRLSEVNAASTVIQGVAHEDANIIFGAVLDERLGDEVKVTVIATGFHEEGRNRAERRDRMLREPGVASVSEEVNAPPTHQAEVLPIQIAETYGSPLVAAVSDAPPPSDVHDGSCEVDEKLPEPDIAEDLGHESEKVHPLDLALELDERPEVSASQEALPAQEAESSSIEDPDGEYSREATSAYDVDESTHDHIEEQDRVVAPNSGEQADIDEDADGAWPEQESQSKEEVADIEVKPVYVERQLVPASSLELTLPESAVIQRETIRMTHFRRAAIAAYAAAAIPEDEPTPDASASTEFAEVLEARRQFIDPPIPRKPELEAEPGLSSDEERAIQVLMEAMSYQEAWEQTEGEGEEADSLEAPAGVEEMVSTYPVLTPTFDDDLMMLSEPARHELAPERAAQNSHPTTPAESQQREFFAPRQTGESDGVPRPLPDFKRRLHWGMGEDQDGQTAESVPRTRIDISPSTSAPDTENDSDELDIPAFLRRGRG